MTQSLPILVAVALAGGCAHEGVAYRNGCWVRSSESRFGDTKEVVSVCEPRSPKWADDPMARAVDSCQYQAQMALYNDAVQRLRTGKPPPDLSKWLELTRECTSTAQRMAESKIRGLEMENDALKKRAAELHDEGAQLRNALIACVEKSPNAIAEAKATTESRSDSDTVAERRGRTVPAVRRTDIQRTSGRDCPPADQAVKKTQ